MIKKLLKKLAFLVTAAISITGLFCTVILAEQQTVIQYTTLGDSIAAGYALPKDKKGYAELIASELGLEIQNLAIPGLNSEQLLHKLQNMQGNELENLKNAKLITISIGSNDILGPFLNMLTSSISRNFNYDSININTDELPEDIYKTASDFMDSGLEGILSPYADVFKNNLPLIANEIKNINPSAQIVFTNFYNPFKNIVIPQLDVSFNEMTDNLMQLLNEILITENNGDYKIADVYTAFEAAYNEGENPVNVSMLAASFDPHPNAYGHELIKQAVINVISIDELFFSDLTSKQESENENEELSNTSDSAIMNVFEDKDLSDNQRQQNLDESTGHIDTQTNKYSPGTGTKSSVAIFTGIIILVSGAGYIYLKKKKN